MSGFAGPGPVHSLLLALAACGDPTVKLEVELTTSAVPALDPYRGLSTLAHVRVSVDGPDRFDDATVDLALSERRAVFEEFPSERTVRVTARGFDAQGNLLAYARADGLRLDAEVSLSLPFRRALAYVIHEPICAACGQTEVCAGTVEGFQCLAAADTCGACPGDRVCASYRREALCRPAWTRSTAGPGKIYVLDLATRGLVQQIAIPGAEPRARGIYAREGRSLVVTYADGAKGFVGELDAATHEWSTFELSRPHELAVIAPGGLGAAAGGGLVTLFDLAAKKRIAEVPVAGRALDAAIGASGRKAIFVMSAAPGVILVDFTRPDRPVTPPGEVLGASGIAMSDNGRFAWVTSNQRRTITQVDMETGAIAELPGGFNGEVGNAAYSERTRSILALVPGNPNESSRVIGYSVVGRGALDPASDLRVLPRAGGIAVGPGGRRMIVVSAGTSTHTAGLTVIDHDLELGADGSNVPYPADPDDGQRYQPRDVAVLYGR